MHQESLKQRVTNVLLEEIKDCEAHMKNKNDEFSNGRMHELKVLLDELVDDECSVSSSGEIRYIDVEVDDNQIVTKSIFHIKLRLNYRQKIILSLKEFKIQQK